MKITIIIFFLVSLIYPQKRMVFAGGESKATYNHATGHHGSVGVIKTYGICESTDYCKANTWVGLFGMTLINDVKDNEAALIEAKKFRSIAITKAAFMVGIPIFLFTGITEANANIERDTDGSIKNQNLSSGAVVLFGLTGASFIGFVVTSVMEKAKLRKVAEVYNKNVDLSFDLNGNYSKFLFGLKKQF